MLYHFYRNKGFSVSKSLELSGMGRSLLQLIKAFLIVAAIIVASYGHYSANALAGDNLNAHAEINKLRLILAQCLGDKEGAVKIGDEWFMCSIYSIGVFPNDSPSNSKK